MVVPLQYLGHDFSKSLWNWQVNKGELTFHSPLGAKIVILVSCMTGYGEQEKKYARIRMNAYMRCVLSLKARVGLK